MAGFLKKIFSFGKKEVVDAPQATPGLRTDGDELKPINWDALKDLTRDADIEAEARAAEEARSQADQAAAREAADKAAAEARAAEAEREAAKAAEAAAKAEAEAAQLAEQARRTAEEAAELKKAEEEAVARAAEKAAQEAETRAQAEALRLAEAAATQKIAQEKAAVEAQEKAEDAARKAAAEAAERAAAEQAAEQEAARIEAERAEADRIAAAEKTRREAEEKARAEAEEKAAVEAEARMKAEAKAKAEREAAARADAAKKAAAKPAYDPGLRTGGDELLAPTWMQPAAKPAPEPEPEPEDEDPANKVTVGKSVEQKQAKVVPTPEPKLPWFQRLRAGMLRSSRELSSNIAGVFTKRKLDDDTLQDLEDVLLRADLGLETAMRVTDTLAATRMGREVSDLEVRAVMGAEIEKVLKHVAKPLELDLSHKPHVILVVGVNGTGKTTTIGKLAAKLTAGGLSVMLAAGDTFRAAAIEQLKIWGERTGSPVVSSKLGADAAGLAYDAYEQAKAEGKDVLIIDTAGRLQNKAELMAELEKIVRVLGKLDPDAPHTVLQTVDATTGQNALNQVEIFRNVAGVNGLVMTKLDGTARGGILVAIAAKHKVPVYFIGVGEQIDDLEPFIAGDFAKAIAGVG